MSVVFLEAFVDPGGCPRPLFFGRTVCQSIAAAGALARAGVVAKVVAKAGAGTGTGGAGFEASYKG